MINPPVISDSAPYQKSKNGEGRRQPPPEAGFVGPSGAVTARLIVAVRIGVAGVGHDSVHFSIECITDLLRAFGSCLRPLARKSALRLWFKRLAV
jgi:hypothetical protein